MKTKTRRSYAILVFLTTVSLLISAWDDLPAVTTGDLTLAQLGGRALVTVLGAGASWVAYIYATPIGGVVVAILYEDVKPLFYDRFGLWPKSQSVGPAEPLPW